MRCLVAITGASGIIYGSRLVDVLRKVGKAGKDGHEVSVIVSAGAEKVARAEKQKLPASDYDENDLGAPFASGSYVCKNLDEIKISSMDLRTNRRSHGLDAMIVCPCSLKTLGEIANGVGSNLIARAAEVCLKERRKLVLVVRETPLSYIAIKNMETVTLAGAIVLPACPGFYGKPKKIGDLVDFVVGKVLDQIGVGHKLFKRWGEKKKKDMFGSCKWLRKVGMDDLRDHYDHDL